MMIFKVSFFFQKNGVEKILGLGTLTDFEKQLLEKAVPELKKNIDVGVEFVKKPKS